MIDPSPTLQALAVHRRSFAGRSLASLFAADPERFTQLSLAWNHWLADFSKQHVTPETVALLLAHARQRNLSNWIAALLAGEKVNLSEALPALHTALRQGDDSPVRVDGVDVMPAVRATQARMRSLSQQLRAGLRLGATGRPIRHVVNLATGGLDLGPRLACKALAAPRPAGSGGVEVGFVSNVDPEHLSRTLAGLDPATTAFIVASKSFTTPETMANAHSAREWLARALGGAALSAHFIAVTGNADAARAFGVASADVLPVWDWVGGRFSLWSAAGLPVAIRCGWETFAEMLAGAARIDAHFREAPIETNLPVLLALVDFWNARFMRYEQRVVVPYAHALALLPAYLQLLALASNGKSVARDGSPLEPPTAAALWGAAGTDGQQAFLQWLHQGTHAVPVEFIVPVRAAHPLADQQTLLIGSALAQAQALMTGRSPEVLRAELAAQGLAPAAAEAQAAHRACPGNRPSTMLLMPELNPRRLGELLALYEHRVFVEGVMFGVDSFDQWGIEPGRAATAPLIAALRDGTLPDADASTRALLEHARSLLPRR